jgi:glutamyl-tRNA synthetase
MHLGSLRTALFNYLFAKQSGGRFLLRIEDTDQKRTVSGADQKLIEDLDWIGLNFDYGPGNEGQFGSFIQSERSELYQKYAYQLLDNGNAYRCFCSSKRLEEVKAISQKAKLATNYDRRCLHLSQEKVHIYLNEKRPFVIRFKVPEKEPYFRFSDLVHGTKIVQYRTVDDVVLLKSDGLPTYHLANVVDDYLMNVTHVIRGEEWLPSTPKHLLLYEAFGWSPPQFAHLPLLIRDVGTKLSKRQDDVHLGYFRKNGYLPEALLNFVALLGWNPASKKRFYTMTELIRDVKRVNDSSIYQKFKNPMQK